jgi:hypothetical protein
MCAFREFFIEEVGFEPADDGSSQTGIELVGPFARSTRENGKGARSLPVGKREERRVESPEENQEAMAKNRLQFDFSDEALEQLDELKDATGAPTRAEVIRQALRMLQWTVEQVRDEDEKNGRQREVIFPFLSSAKATANGR